MDYASEVAIFKDRVAIVTGAAHGFGRETCAQLAHSGANVFGLDVLEDELEETAKLANSGARFGGAAFTCRVDVTNESEIISCVETVVDRFGKIDILVNNAGGVLGQVYQPIESVLPERWLEIINVNLTGAFFMIRAVAPYMKTRHYGRIINVSSGAGRSFSLTGIQAYASAKAGQIGLTRQMAHELGPYQITVNNVAPGFVISNPATAQQWEAMGQAGQEALVDAIPLKRLGTKADVAKAILFFATDAASWISGQVISVDGGHQLF